MHILGFPFPDRILSQAIVSPKGSRGLRAIFSTSPTSPSHLQAQQGADHVFIDSLCLSLGLSSDLAMEVETCVAPAEDFLDKRKADELFPEKQREDLMGENFLDKKFT